MNRPTTIAALAEVWREASNDVRFSDLRNGATQFVKGEGRMDRPPIALVGEAPGRQEDEQGQPFVGASGQLLFKLLHDELALTRTSVWTTNIVKYRPPDNRTPFWAELQAGAHYLRRELAIVRPRVIVTLGSAPLSVMVPKVRITDVHGQQIQLRSGRSLVPMFHPAYLLRKRELIAEFRADLAVVAELIRGET